MQKLVAPHGGELINRIVKGKEREELVNKARCLRKIVLNAREISDLEMIAIGGFSPLSGFMLQEDYQRVIRDKRLASGLPWTLPVTLSVTREEADSLREGEDVALSDNAGKVLAVLHLEEKYVYDKREEARLVYCTEEAVHPGVRALYAQGEVLLGGKISVVNRPGHDKFPRYRLDPAQTRQIFQERGWKKVVGFQTRNPVHRAHEYILKCALEIVDGLLLHPLVGETKKDDIPAEVRMQCYEVLIEKYYPRERVVLAVNPASMRYAGPREAIFHAIIRKNYGCTHFIVGRDHAGVGNFYSSFAAQEIFDEFSPEEVGIVPLCFSYTFYCRKCQGIVSHKTCPHTEKEHFSLSGTKVRELLRAGEIPPVEFTRPEVSNILIEWWRQKGSENGN